MTMEIITKALEEHATAVSGMGDSIKELKDRLLSVEQKTAGGIDDFGSLDNAVRSPSGNLLTKMTSSASVKAFFASEDTRGKSALDATLLVKNTILGESGVPQNPDSTLVQAERLPGVVAGAFRSLNVLDFLQVEPVGSNMVEYSRELSWTNDAAETAEGQLKPESDLTFELVQENVRTIAHWIKTSRQAWMDSPWLQTYLSERMQHGIRKRLQTQIIGGDGANSNLAGITTAGRHTAFTPQAGETELDALNRSKYEIEGSDYMADFVILNPADVGNMERQRRTSSDDAFTLAEGGAAAFVSNGMSSTVWGVPVIKTNDLPAGKFIMGSRDAMRLMLREQAVVEFFEQDGDNVQRNLMTVRAEMRAAFAVMLPVAVRYGDLTA